MKFIKNHLFLLSLVLVMVLDPFLEDYAFGTLISLLLLTLSIGLCIYVLSNNKNIFWTMIIISTPIIGFNYCALLFPTESLIAVQYISMSLLFFLYASFLFYLLVTLKRISISDISHAISVYLLIGIAFGFLYSFLEVIQPGSIVYQFDEGKEISGDMIYFSFVTLTTLGFGDILPINKIAKVVVMVEAVMGVLYIAIMIGRLVGISPLKSNEKDNQ